MSTTDTTQRPDPDQTAVVRSDPDAIPPVDGPQLRLWIERQTGIRIANQAVCSGHVAPWDFFQRIHLERPPLALVLGPRGGGKSFLSALDTHLISLRSPKHETRILGGSKAQSEQIVRGLRELIGEGQDRGNWKSERAIRLLRGGAEYPNGSQVSILAASPTSVRGPHVPSLKLDEIDEIDPEIREAAMGMCMGRRLDSASVLMTSTWHRPHGPMAGLIERAHAGDFPLFTFCIFEVLERCTPERSGRQQGDGRFEKCADCPLMRHCYEGVGDRELPKAKRSDGHYPIDSLIQKLRAVSVRTFEADYLCKGPKTDGIWFPGFDAATHISPDAEYDPTIPVHISIDSGVFTGAVFLQVATRYGPGGPIEEVRVFADYLTEGLTAERNAIAILELARTRCNGRVEGFSTDPSGGSRNAVGPTVLAEYERVGLRPMQRWPRLGVADGLALLESFVQPADGRTRFSIHPRCVATTQAMQNYRRARRGGQWQDYPEDPQHPFEELVDALRGGLLVRFPNGRSPQPNFARVPARQVF